MFKLKGGYLAIGTWVIAEILRLIVANIKRTGGGSGITIQAATKLGTEVRVPGSYWWASGARRSSPSASPTSLLRSRTGLALKAIRDNDLAAESTGVNLWRTKLYTYVIAGAGCALVGAIVAIHLLRVQPAAAFSHQLDGVPDLHHGHRRHRHHRGADHRYRHLLRASRDHQQVR